MRPFRKYNKRGRKVMEYDYIERGDCLKLDTHYYNIACKRLDEVK